MLNRKTLLAFATCLIAVGCASTPPGKVIPMEGGQNEVIATGKSEQIALDSALKTAKAHCAQHRYVVLDRQTSYRGLVTPETNQAIETAQKVVAMTAGEWFPTLSSDEDYLVTLKIRCGK